jgi:hypothetical protein
MKPHRHRREQMLIFWGWAVQSAHRWQAIVSIYSIYISFHIMQWLSSIYILLISHVGLAMVYTLGPTTRSNLGILEFHHRMDR